MENGSFSTHAYRSEVLTTPSDSCDSVLEKCTSDRPAAVRVAETEGAIGAHCVEENALLLVLIVFPRNNDYIMIQIHSLDL